MALSGRPLPNSGAVSGVLEALAFFREADFARTRFERLGDVFETKLLGQQLVFIRGERAISDLFSQSDGTVGWWPESVRQLLGSRSLANRNGADHRARRRVVGQLFSAAALRRYSPVIVALVDQLAAELKVSTGPVRLVDRMRRFAFAVIALVVLGLEGDDIDALFADFEIWTRALFSVPIAIPGSPFAKALQARARLLERLRGVLVRAKDRPTGGLDLLSGGLDEAGLPLTDDDLVEQLLLLLFAGYETTASSLSCLMAALLQHPPVLHWLQAEVQTLAWPLPEAIAAPRLDAVVKEVMRLNPPVGGFFRRTTRPLLLDGVLVPEGRVVQVAIAASNRTSSSDASDLDAFRPERHLEPDHGLTLLPFGGGERVCLGKALAELEIRLMAVGLLQQVVLQLVPEQDLTLALIPSPSPRDGLLVAAC
ncbi:cytochrome P450 [Vulcanococcus sp.]|jgi:cytochrome P450|uniref:cytochrome P450 n=1 Tax=Vulcanococcus sp. TaxID=2856995 RepID=UPI0037D9E339